MTNIVERKERGIIYENAVQEGFKATCKCLNIYFLSMKDFWGKYKRHDLCKIKVMLWTWIEILILKTNENFQMKYYAFLQIKWLQGLSNLKVKKCFSWQVLLDLVKQTIRKVILVLTSKFYCLWMWSPWAARINSFSIESSNQGWLPRFVFKSISVLLRWVMSGQITPDLHHRIANEYNEEFISIYLGV